VGSRTVADKVLIGFTRGAIWNDSAASSASNSAVARDHRDREGTIFVVELWIQEIFRLKRKLSCVH